MSQVKLQSDNGAEAARLLRSLKRTQITIAFAYLYDSLMLFGYSAVGFVDVRVPLTVIALFALLVGAVHWAHSSGWSHRQKDPTLFLPQQLYAISVALGVALVAPQIGFQPFATLFAIGAFSFMAPNTRSLAICWAGASIGAVAVIFFVGPRLAMPTSSLAGQALTGGVVVGLLARCVWIATFFRKLQRRLGEKNKALKAAINRIEVLANRDELTGLPNRRSITKWLDEQIASCGRTSLALSVALVDIDHFKRINDAYGHLAGDRALQIFSEIASGAIRATDRIGRYGGEEFLVILTATTLHAAEASLERLRERLAGYDWTAIDPDLHVTITIGVTQYTPGEPVEELTRRADLALYLGKESGRDRIVLDPTLAARPTSQAA
ncbi:GGDEF domain-containing protein [Methylocapsa sp. S129]|uniref:GGDEF domain-containing protein n=1 Tax=Methylocapsa sp. S129 TaxID=1641869 RepID=UPI00131A9F38|nr:GGDEF domain-containing protein [Methylocapsa sp. S129]